MTAPVLNKVYFILMWCALLGVVMPITDAYLAYEAQASFKVIFKYVATIVYSLPSLNKKGCS